MAKLIELTGQKFAHLTVLAYAGSRLPRGGALWECLCVCGKRKVVEGDKLRRKIIRSCGCRQSEKSSPGGKSTHGHTRKYQRTPEYQAWMLMKRRCYNPADASFAAYGGSGITVCDRWKHSFENFLEDMGERPSGLTIDRKDGTKGYEPDNCRWATWKTQCNNRKSNLVFTIDGITQTLKQWTETLGLQYQMIWKRIKRGWPIERALYT